MSDRYDEYARLSNMIKALTKQKDELKERIVEEMRQQNSATVSGSQCSIRLSPRSKMAVDDQGLSEFLTEQGIAPDRFLSNKVCHTKLQQIIASGEINAEQLFKYITVEPYDVLLVSGSGASED